MDFEHLLGTKIITLLFAGITKHQLGAKGDSSSGIRKYKENDNSLIGCTVEHAYTCSNEEISCTDHAFECGDGQFFSCYNGFSCSSLENFSCSNGQQIRGSDDQFQCSKGESGLFRCSFENEAYVCNKEIFVCEGGEGGASFICSEGEGYDFDCTNSGTYDFQCGRTARGYYYCISEVTSGFQCSANHWFMCSFDFTCEVQHGCSPQGGQCLEQGQWTETPGDDGKPSDFNCWSKFDCGAAGSSPSGSFDCTAQSQFICRGDNGQQFVCHNNFDCHPTDGLGYPDASFTCVDDAFECDDYECLHKFKCFDHFHCYNDFDCDNNNFSCEAKNPCPNPNEYMVVDLDKYKCDDFDCTGGFNCSHVDEFAGCIPQSDFECPIGYTCNGAPYTF